MNNFEVLDTDTDTDTEIDEDGKPQPYAGFKRKYQSTSQKRKFDWDQTDVIPGIRKSVSAPPVLAPMAESGGCSGDQKYEDESQDHDTSRPWVYFPANVDIESLVDWKQKTEENNNHMDDDMSRDKAALVNINNKELAVFRYGQGVIAINSRCPHAGGPLHQGDIEVLPDRSLCVRCPWHKWAFRVNQADGCQEKGNEGECVFPPGRDDKRLQIFPSKVDRKRSQIKIGFQSFDERMLVNETF